jgi:hypothetical protein
LYTARDFTTIWISSYFHDFQQSGPNYFSAKFLIFEVQKAATVLPKLRENITKLCKRMGGYELDIGPGAAERGRRLNGTLEINVLHVEHEIKSIKQKLQIFYTGQQPIV